MLVYISLPRYPLNALSILTTEFLQHNTVPRAILRLVAHCKVHSVCDSVRSCAFELQTDAESDVKDVINKGHEIGFALLIGHTFTEMSHEKVDKAL